MLETYLLNQFGTFVLVLSRVGGLVATAPVLGAKAVPVQARAGLAIALTLLITPIHSGNTNVDVTQLLTLGRYVLAETMLGLLLGLGVMILLNGVQLTGQIISQLGGTALTEGYDANLDDNAPVYSQLLYFLTLGMFLLLDGHRLLTEALLDTYAWLPPGEATLGDSYVAALTMLLSQSFVLGVRAAAPAMTALLLSTLVLGLIGRTVPQINVLVVGFNLNALLTVGGLAASLGAVAWAVPQHTGAAVDLLRDAVRTAAEMARQVGAPA